MGGDINSTHQRHQLVLRAEMVHPRQHALCRSALREYTTTDVERLDHLQISLADRWRSPGFADALCAIFRLQDNQPATSTVGETARRAVALTGAKVILQRYNPDIADAGHQSLLFIQRQLAT